MSSDEGYEWEKLAPLRLLLVAADVAHFKYDINTTHEYLRVSGVSRILRILAELKSPAAHEVCDAPVCAVHHAAALPSLV